MKNHGNLDLCAPSCLRPPTWSCKTFSEDNIRCSQFIHFKVRYFCTKTQNYRLPDHEVNVRRARLVMGWATLSGCNARCGTFTLVCNQPPRSTQPSHPVVGRRSEYKPKGDGVLWPGVKAGMVRVWAGGRHRLVTQWPLSAR